MRRYLARRVLQLPVALFYIILLTFVVTRLTGDPTPLMLPPDATLEEIAAFRERLGLDDPVHVQFIRFLSGVLHGDFGRSLHFHQDSLELVLQRLPATAELSLAALTIAVAVGLPVGILSATRRGTWIDDLSTVFALIGQSTPIFWMGLMLIMFFSVRLNVLPVCGRGTASHLVLPAVTLGMYSTARIARLARSSILEVMGQDYIRTAYAKGLSSQRVMLKHVLKNAAVPLITMIGLQIGALFGGAVVTETVFAWPGVGLLVTQAIITRDFPVVVAAVFVSACIFMLLALVVDVLYCFFNPLIRYD